MKSNSIPLRSALIIWLRKTHGWIGLWGATLGLLFGFSGIWLNHRTVLPLQPAMERQNSQLQLVEPLPTNEQAMALWLRHSLGGLDSPTNVRVEKSRPAPWADGATGVVQPEHWTFNFYTPQTLIQAEYWVGNRSVNVRRTDNGIVATMANLHKGVGMSAPWILLVDTLAGSMILLSLSGLSLWMLTRRTRTLGIVVFCTALALTAGLACL